MVRTKVFVGNLSFKVTDAELASQFSAAGNVVSAKVITRGPRSLGYGFVEMQSDEEADKAIQLLNKKDIEGREINVEVAKAREDGEQAPEKKKNSLRKRPRKPRQKKKPVTEGEDGGNEKKEAAPPRRKKPKKPRKKTEGEKAEKSGEKAEKVEKGEKTEKGEKEAPKPRRRRYKKKYVKKPRVRNDEERTPSKTTLFVANLPFVLNDETFGDVLKEANLPFKQAHVVKKYNGRSKGYGFIEFSNEEEQKNALEALNKRVVETRELSVKIAFTELKVPEPKTPTPTPTPEVEKSEGKEEKKTEKKEKEPEKEEVGETKQ